MTANTRKIKERNHYFDSLKYWLFVFVVLIHNPLHENLWGGGYGQQSLAVQFLHISLFQDISAKEQRKSILKKA